MSQDTKRSQPPQNPQQHDKKAHDEEALGPGQPTPGSPGSAGTPTQSGGANVTAGTPNSPNAPATLGTGAATTPSTTVDPNIDIAREQAKNVHAQKVAAGEDAGEPPPDPVSLANKGNTDPTGPVADGMRRVRVKSSVMTGGRHYDAGRVVDIPDAEAESLGAAVEKV